VDGGRDRRGAERDRCRTPQGENTMTHWTRRDMLRTAGAGVAAMALAPLATLAGGKPTGYVLPKLPYDYDALMPYIDEETMRIHHDKHHAAYVKNVNAALKDEPKLLAKSIFAVLRNIDSVPEKVRQAVINNGGGHANHTIFWQIMGPKGGGEPGGALGKAIARRFESFDKFQQKLSQAANTRFGSGWGWLVLSPKGELEVISAPNQDCPVMKGLFPIVGVDVWEHAYYLKYKNDRPAYVKAWWNTINWKNVAERYDRAQKMRKERG
jgi:Fe-Mn family superoxide dismutase